MKHFCFALILSFFACVSVNGLAQSHVIDSMKAIEAQIRVEFEQKQAMVQAEQDKKDAIIHMEMRRQKIICNFLAIAFLAMLAYVLFLLSKIRKLKQ